MSDTVLVALISGTFGLLGTWLTYRLKSGPPQSSAPADAPIGSPDPVSGDRAYWKQRPGVGFAFLWVASTVIALGLIGSSVDLVHHLWGEERPTVMFLF